MKERHLQSTQFAVCLNNKGYEASLEMGKIYPIVQNEEAEANDLVMLIDESGEEYAFAANRFYPIEVPEPVEAVLLSDSSRRV